MHSQAIVEFGQPLADIEQPTPEPKGTEVLVEIAHCGVCHSDIHIHDGYFDLGDGKKLPFGNMKLPHTLGHEIEGTVIAVGADAKDVKRGARYAIYPWIGCGECAACKRDEGNYCLKPRNLGCTSGYPGGYATHVMVPHPKYLLEYGATPPALAAAYMCSGLTAFSALRKVGRPAQHEAIVILGCGGVGLMAIQFVKALLDSHLIAADIADSRLEAARKGGAKATYNTRVAGAAKQLVADTDGGAFAVVDFVGSPESFAFANASVRKGGRIIVVGLFGGAMSMPLPMFPLRGLSIIGSYVGSLSEARDMMEIVRRGNIDPIPFTTRPLSDANAALSDLRQGKVTGRVVLTP